MLRFFHVESLRQLNALTYSRGERRKIVVIGFLIFALHLTKSMGQRMSYPSKAICLFPGGVTGVCSFHWLIFILERDGAGYGYVLR